MSKLSKPTGLPVSTEGISTVREVTYTRQNLSAPSTSASSAAERFPGTSFNRTQIRPILQPSQQSRSCLVRFSTCGIEPSSSATSMAPSRQSITKKKELQYKTKITVSKPTGQTSKSIKADKTLLHANDSDKQTRIGSPFGSKRSAAAVPIPPPSVLRKQIALEIKDLAAKAPFGSKLTAVGAKKSTVPPLMKIITPAGPQQVIQQVVTEKRVERSKLGEVVARSIRTTEMEPRSGETRQLEEEAQMLNPHFAARKGPLKEIITIVNEKDVTSSYETRKENIVHETIKLDADIGMDPTEVDQLVEEEREDIINVLRNPSPDLVNQSPHLYPLKKRIYALRLSPENTMKTEQAVVNPVATADETVPEASPELMAAIMDYSSAVHKSAAQQNFSLLYGWGANDDRTVIVSSATPGPLADVVVPSSIPKVIHEEMLSQRMEDTAVILQAAVTRPPLNTFEIAKPTKPKKRVTKKRWYKSVLSESPPWSSADLHVVVASVGATPKNYVHATDILETTQNGNIYQEMTKGIEYILDVEPLQYYSRVQLRGSRPPSWFPGYMMALSDMSNTIEIAKTPSQVLFSAWRSVQPDVFSDDSIVYN